MVERYSGDSTDGPWSEGSTETSTILGPVAPGHYDLLLDASSGDASYMPFPGRLDVNLTAGVSVNWVAWVATLLLAVVPLFLLWRGLEFEKERWSESEFSKNES